MPTIPKTPRESKGNPERKQEHPFFQSKEDYKEFYVIQQSILLSFLNGFCTITLKRQKKQSIRNLPYPQIISLKFDDEEINVQELADIIQRPVYEDECKLVKKKQTAMRRFEKNRKIFIQHLLIDLLREKGFQFESKLARNTGKTLRLERIEKIFYGGRLIMDINDFIERGYLINSFINSQLSLTSIITIPKSSNELSNIILSQNLIFN
ncbi:hypothetical protein EHI8A_054060 [Entamoeba histolytica HM-1:IMSS-B]|uniref:Uncharacterized protein n=6 Tax=Entamoeba histolytica TaxID=5759 RepID=C4M6X9_ENTH1|nr:hypothetical protein EHI_033010 [Entamoeba histolytica HM-1:IMSS]EMD47746.1 Hypothetical protein EHI5A_088950 [Entamoeba histolytica KU27]EMH76803.1 hypothetical protein EHI8A_054060 [Entamoeba histolytica HM-1:IMSS-B]EMS14907.1 hypothetical protein KM1_105230 [Entamoeba histolytica HM-3:IMSS]ENY65331.1 hypothetical protein EHI7A_054750 [Entamoeba histolytica HM-1:IMSS-A]GAT97261.1 hypothetical protein CL6EHI_033010 [Entamoeba histolytica]|eukprot:XP_650893.1 hypothetical protein EHI_033010 [Entamoeba histolytica HM-1:IMSS]